MEKVDAFCRQLPRGPFFPPVWKDHYDVKRAREVPRYVGIIMNHAGRKTLI